MRRQFSAFALVAVTALAGCSSATPAPPGETAQPPSQQGTAETRPVRALALERLHMVDESQGWATAAGGVFRTTDSGATWMDVTPAAAQIRTDTLTTVFADARRAWLIAPGSPTGTLFRTDDGGKAWDQRPLPFGVVTDMAVVGSQRAWVLTSGGAAMGSSPIDVLATEDGGKTWTTLAVARPDTKGGGTIPFGRSKSGLVFLDEKTGWLTGYSPAVGSPYVYRTKDGGRTWEREDPPLYLHHGGGR